jgi:hypothetical protein
MPYGNSGPAISKRTIFGGAAAVFCIIILVVVLIGGFGMNNLSDWQVKQSINGHITVIDNPGWYMKMFASVWTYPRAYQTEYGTGDDDSGNQTVRVTFNDGGTAQVSSMIRFGTPKREETRLLSHREFGSIGNIASSVRAHLVNCMKASAPLMSSSEHQSARKAEFTQIVDDMLRKGIYQMRQVETQLKDQTDETGAPITVMATEVIRDENGLPEIAQTSPLLTYDIEVLQFSITSTNYDEITLQKFAAKKESYLRAEQSKAEREEEVQQRLMVIEKGKRELAEVEAAANKEMMTATVNAERDASVARIDAQKKVTVAEQTKLEAETAASQKVAVAELQLAEAKLIAQSADEQAKAIRVLAAAEEEKIQKGGAITEHERVLAQIEWDGRAKVMEAFAQMSPNTLVPSVMIDGGGGAGSGTSMKDDLIVLKLLQELGMLNMSQARPGAGKMIPSSAAAPEISE